MLPSSIDAARALPRAHESENMLESSIDASRKQPQAAARARRRRDQGGRGSFTILCVLVVLDGRRRRLAWRGRGRGRRSARGSRAARAEPRLAGGPRRGEGERRRARLAAGRREGPVVVRTRPVGPSVARCFRFVVRARGAGSRRRGPCLSVVVRLADDRAPTTTRKHSSWFVSRRAARRLPGAARRPRSPRGRAPGGAEAVRGPPRGRRSAFFFAKQPKDLGWLRRDFSPRRAARRPTGGSFRPRSPSRILCRRGGSGGSARGRSGPCARA